MARLRDKVLVWGLDHSGCRNHCQSIRPRVGGLFLAFPAIFPASATLIEKHEKQKKQRQGLDGTVRGRMAASIDAAGAAIGSLGLAVFALVMWKLAPRDSHWMVLIAATASWLAVSVLVWKYRKAA